MTNIKSYLSLLFLSIFCFLFSNPAMAYEVIPLSVSVTIHDTESTKAMKLFNEARLAQEKSALTFDSALMDEAIQRACELVVWYSHARPAGILSSYEAVASGENIACGQRSGEAYFNSCKNSAGHWQTAMSDSYHSTAIVCVSYANGDIYWVQLFGERSGDGDTYAGMKNATRTVELSNGNLIFCRENTSLSLSTVCDTTPIRIYNYYHANGAKVGFIPNPDLFQCASSNPAVFTVDSFGHIYPKSAGTATLSVSLANSTDSHSHTSTIEIRILPIDLEASSTFTYQYDKKQDYTGATIKPELVIIDGNNHVLQEFTDYTISYGANTAANSTGYLYVAGCGNYKGHITLSFSIGANKTEETESVQVPVASGTPVSTFLANFDYIAPNVTVSQNSFIYDGTSKTPSVTVSVKNTLLKENVSYILQYQRNISIGRASITITGINNCSGSYTTYFDIVKPAATPITPPVVSNPVVTKPVVTEPAPTTNPVSPGTISVTVSTTSPVETSNISEHHEPTVPITTVNSYSVTIAKKSYHFTGKVIRPVVSVLLNGKRLAGKYYQVSYRNNKKAGIASVKVTGIGSYQALNRQITFIILPAKPSFAYARWVSKKQIRITWKKNTQCSSYQIQLSTDKSYKRNIKNINVKKSIVSLLLKNMNAKKKYYIRIRCLKQIGKTTLYSNWSQTKRL